MVRCKCKSRVWRNRVPIPVCYPRVCTKCSVRTIHHSRFIRREKREMAFTDIFVGLAAFNLQLLFNATSIVSKTKFWSTILCEKQEIFNAREARDRWSIASHAWVELLARRSSHGPIRERAVLVRDHRATALCVFTILGYNTHEIDFGLGNALIKVMFPQICWAQNYCENRQAILW